MTKNNNNSFILTELVTKTSKKDGEILYKLTQFKSIKAVIVAKGFYKPISKIFKG